jgi:hypothetical protein
MARLAEKEMLTGNEPVGGYDSKNPLGRYSLPRCQDYGLAEGQNDLNIDGKALNKEAFDGSVLRLIQLRLHGAPGTLKGK